MDSFKAEQPTKTKAGERTVRMSDLLKRKMQEYRLRSLFSQYDDLVFPAQPGGSPTSGKGTIGRVLRRLIGADNIVCPAGARRG